MTRYAVFYAPVPRSGFHRRLSAWLGRDAHDGAALAQPALPGFSAKAVHALTAEPRRYGAHATFKPPFHARPGLDGVAIGEAVAALASRLAPVALPRLQVTRIGRFLALTPARDSADVAALGAACVRELDALRAPASEAELARRRAAGLSTRQEALLARWGYPYVMEEFRFHITLTGQADREILDRLAIIANNYFVADLEAEMLIDALTLFTDSGEGKGFVIKARYSLRG
jgi:putative phosphonate metabolism protein